MAIEYIQCFLNFLVIIKSTSISLIEIENGVNNINVENVPSTSKRTMLTPTSKARLFSETQLVKCGTSNMSLSDLARKYNVSRDYPNRLLKHIQSGGSVIRKKEGVGRKNVIDEKKLI